MALLSKNEMATKAKTHFRKTIRIPPQTQISRGRAVTLLSAHLSTITNAFVAAGNVAKMALTKIAAPSMLTVEFAVKRAIFQAFVVLPTIGTVLSRIRTPIRGHDRTPSQHPMLQKQRAIHPVVTTETRATTNCRHARKRALLRSNKTQMLSMLPHRTMSNRRLMLPPPTPYVHPLKQGLVRNSIDGARGQIGGKRSNRLQQKL